MKVNGFSYICIYVHIFVDTFVDRFVDTFVDTFCSCKHIVKETYLNMCVITLIELLVNIFISLSAFFIKKMNLQLR